MTTISLCRTLLGKDIYEIQDSDLIEFFATEQEETALLEFKSGEVTLEKLCREIAAFANTEGGVVIVGAPREKEIKRGADVIKTCTGALTSSTFRNKDWLSQKIASQVVPFPVGVRIQELSVVDGKRFIVEVPQSSNPPHQISSEGAYYLRLEREARPAPHGLVQALFTARRKPSLRSSLQHIRLDKVQCEVTVAIHNDSPVPADKVAIVVDVFDVSSVTGGFNYNRDGENDEFEKFTYSNRDNGVVVQVMRIPITFTVKHQSRPFLISSSFWSKEADFDCQWWVLDPELGAVIEKGALYNEESQSILAVLKKYHKS